MSATSEDTPESLAFCGTRIPRLSTQLPEPINDTLASHRLNRRHGIKCRSDWVMISDRIVQLCKDVERLACELDRLTARGHSRTVYAVLMRMKLAAMTAELVTADLVERLQQAPAIAKADSEAARAPR